MVEKVRKNEDGEIHREEALMLHWDGLVARPGYWDWAGVDERLHYLYEWGFTKKSKVYVGLSARPKTRATSHFGELQSEHSSKRKAHEDYIECGRRDFFFRVVAVFDDRQVGTYFERKLQQRYKNEGREYNLQIWGIGPFYWIGLEEWLKTQVKIPPKPERVLVSGVNDFNFQGYWESRQEILQDQELTENE